MQPHSGGDQAPGRHDSYKEGEGSFGRHGITRTARRAFASDAESNKGIKADKGRGKRSRGDKGDEMVIDRQRGDRRARTLVYALFGNERLAAGHSRRSFSDVFSLLALPEKAPTSRPGLAHVPRFSSPPSLSASSPPTDTKRPCPRRKGPQTAAAPSTAR